jgi:hypothetical protein
VPKLTSQSKLFKFFIILSLALLVLGSSLATLHSFSHHEVASSKTTSLKVTSLHKSFFEKIIFAHEKSSGKKSEHCFLCAALNFQNQIFLTPNLIFTTAIFYLVFALRYFDRIKLSYLLSSKAPRAPPVIS